MPVPYNLNIELYVMAKQSDDALQIVEQVLTILSTRLYTYNKRYGRYGYCKRYSYCIKQY